MIKPRFFVTTIQNYFKQARDSTISVLKCNKIVFQNVIKNKKLNKYIFKKILWQKF